MPQPKQINFQYRGTTNRVNATRSTPRQWVAFGLALIILVGLVYLLIRPDERPQYGIVNSAKTEPEIIEPTIPPPRVDESILAADINNIIAANGQLDISVSYRDITTGAAYHYGLSDAFTSASIGKLLTAVTYLKNVDDSIYGLDSVVGGKPAKEQLKLLIEQSDNAAWDSLDSQLGSSKLNAMASAIGMKPYDLSQKLLTTEDTALLLEKLYKGEILSPSSTDLLLSHMQAANYRQYIVAAVPEGITVYHKVGYLKDRAHDAAIIDNGRHPYVLVIFTKARNGGYDFVTGPSILQNITKAVHKAYE